MLIHLFGIWKVIQKWVIKHIIDALDSQFVLPLIALIEAMFVIEKGRTSLPSAGKQKYPDH